MSDQGDPVVLEVARIAALSIDKVYTLPPQAYISASYLFGNFDTLCLKKIGQFS